MSVSPIFEVEFNVSRPAASGKAPLPTRKAVVIAASSHPKDLLAVLNADVSLNVGEQLNIVAVSQIHVGSEGASVLS